MNNHLGSPGAGSREELMTALFANVVVQNASMALMFLGKLPNPETGKEEKDLDAAQLFIDQLEMLEIKTKGNLNAEEQQLLQQNLTALRLEFVAAGKETPPGETTESSATPPEPQDTPEARKKFSKKY
jgi:hypothetical protein